MLIKSVDDQTIRYRLLKELQKSPALDHSQKQWLKKQLNMMGKGS